MSILYIGSLFCKKIGLWSLRSPRVVTFSCLLLSLLYRGDCGGCVGIPLSVEVIVVGVLAKCLIPLMRGDCVGFVSIPLLREVDCDAPIPRVRGRHCDVYTQVENTLTYIR